MTIYFSLTGAKNISQVKINFVSFLRKTFKINIVKENYALAAGCTNPLKAYGEVFDIAKVGVKQCQVNIPLRPAANGYIVCNVRVPAAIYNLRVIDLHVHLVISNIVAWVAVEPDNEGLGIAFGPVAANREKCSINFNLRHGWSSIIVV